jgi:hypothetical protein
MLAANLASKTARLRIIGFNQNQPLHYEHISANPGLE